MLKQFSDFDSENLRERRLVFEADGNGEADNVQDAPESEMPSETRLNAVEDEFLSKTSLDLSVIPLEALQMEEATRTQIAKTLGNNLNEILDSSQDQVIRNAIQHKLKTRESSENWKDKAEKPFHAVKRLFTPGEKFLKKHDESILSAKKINEIKNDQELAVKKAAIYSPEFLEDKFGKQLNKVPWHTKTRLGELLDWQKLVDEWQENPASRILLGNLTSAKNRDYLKEIASVGVVSTAEIAQAEKDQKNAKEELDGSTAKTGKRVELDATVKAESQAKQKLADLEKMMAAKKEMEGLRDEREGLTDKKPGRLKKWKSKVHEKTSSEIKQNNQALKNNGRKVTALGKLFYEKKIGSIDLSSTPLPSDPDTIIEGFLDSGGAVKAALNKSELEEHKTKATRELEAATRKKESAEKLNTAAKTEFTEKYNHWQELKTSKESAKLEKKKMSPRELLTAIKTKAFEKSLGADGVTEKIEEKARSMATAAVNSEISNVKNDVYTNKLKQQAEEAMKERGFKNTLAGKTLSLVGAGFNKIDKDKDDNRRSVKTFNFGKGILKRVAKDVFYRGREGS